MRENGYANFPDVNGKRLHMLISEYCLHRPTEEGANKTYDDLNQWLNQFTPPDEGHNPRFILDVNGTNSTHLHHLFHMPFTAEGSMPDQFRTQKALKLFKRICDFCYDALEDSPGQAPTKQSIGWQEFADFLVKRNDYNFTALHDAVKFGQKDLYDALLKEEGELRKATLPNGQPVLDDTSYAQQFIAITPKGLSVVRSAVISKKRALYTAITDELDALLAKGVIPKTDYARQFLVPCGGMTLLQDAVMSDNKDTFHDVVSRLKLLYQEGLATREELRSVIMPTTTNGASLLQLAAANANPKCYADVMAALKGLRDFGIIDNHDIAQQLTNKNNAGITVVHSAALTRHKQNYCQVMDDLKDFHTRFDETGKPYISIETLAAQLTAPSDKEFTVLHNALASRDNDLLMCVEKDLKTYVKKPDLQLLLMGRTQDKNNLYHHAASVADNFLASITGLHKLFAHAFGDDAPQKIQELYDSPNDQGMTARHDGQPPWLKNILDMGLQAWPERRPGRG